MILIKRCAFTLIFLSFAGCNSREVTKDAKKVQPVTESKVADKKIENKNYDGPLFPALKNGKYGYININGAFIIPPTFTDANPFSEGLAAVHVGGHSFIAGGEKPYLSTEGGKWGYIDRAGEIKIAPQFDVANRFSDGLVLAAIRGGAEGEAGYIDQKGLFKIAPKYSSSRSESFAHGMAFVHLAKIPASPEFNLKRGVNVDSSGDEISSAIASSMWREHRRADRGQWINTAGEEIDEIKALTAINVERIAFKKETQVIIHGRTFDVTLKGLKDMRGKVIANAKYHSIGNFYREENLTSFKYSFACMTSEWEIMGGAVAVTKSHKCGVIDINGNVVAPFDFDRIRVVSDEFAVFEVGCRQRWYECSDAKAGLFSIKDRKIIVNPRFDSMVGLNDDLLVVKVDNKYGYMNTSGAMVIEPKFTNTRLFQDGLAEVDFPPSYIDKAGKIIYKGTIGDLKVKPIEKPNAPPIDSPSQGKNPTAKHGTGTAFFVSKDGQAITNFHVIDGCSELHVEGKSEPVTLIASDTVNDLSLIKIGGVAPASAAIADDPAKLRQGEEIVAFGFPLNAVLSSGGNLTPGVVSALTGLGNNTNQIQITAPIQPGSSGSPVINKKGEVVGVVSMKISDSKMAKATGQIAQNINFAVSGQTLKAFLNANQVKYRTGSGFLALDKSAADLADEARKWTLVLECWK